MAEIIELVRPEKSETRSGYSVDITPSTDNLMFTVRDIKVSPGSLSKIADELEKIAQIIRADIVTGMV